MATGTSLTPFLHAQAHSAAIRRDHCLPMGADFHFPSTANTVGRTTIGDRSYHHNRRVHRHAANLRHGCWWRVKEPVALRLGDLVPDRPAACLRIQRWWRYTYSQGVGVVADDLRCDSQHASIPATQLPTFSPTHLAHGDGFVFSHNVSATVTSAWTIAASRTNATMCIQRAWRSFRSRQSRVDSTPRSRCIAQLRADFDLLSSEAASFKSSADEIADASNTFGHTMSTLAESVMRIHTVISVSSVDDIVSVPVPTSTSGSFFDLGRSHRGCERITFSNALLLLFGFFCSVLFRILLCQQPPRCYACALGLVGD